MAKYDFSKYANVPPAGTAPFEELFKPKTSWVKQRKWDIPDVLVIKVAPVGSFLMKEDNPNQKYSAEEIMNEMITHRWRRKRHLVFPPEKGRMISQSLKTMFNAKGLIWDQMCPR